MRVGVITPYYRESGEMLRRCHESVLKQTHGNVMHFMIADGNPHPDVDQWNVRHIKLDHHGDFGDTPRVIGALSASSLGCDALTLLDADNYFEPNHVETLLAVHKASGVHVVTGTRNLMREDLSFMMVDTESDGRNFNDTNCYLIMKPAFDAFASWGFKEPAAGITGDRVFWDTVVKRKYSRAHCSRPTVNYVTTFAFHYNQNNETPPPNAKIIVRFPNETHSRMLLYSDYQKLMAATGS